MTQYEVFQYTGKQLDIEWDGRLCIHMGECGCAEGELFSHQFSPYIFLPVALHWVEPLRAQQGLPPVSCSAYLQE
jgi:uncharacterized Fe-S cluster protein YjdI